jgi:FixJ family two-component response regulator
MSAIARVLVLDDDADFRELLGELLIELGVRSCVTSGSLAELQRRDVDALACGLAILDINLGRGQPSGIDAFHWLVDRGFGGKTIFLTGHAASHPLVVEAATDAHVPILTKPMDASQLADLVQERS